MTDATGHMNRPGAGPFSVNMSIGGIPLNRYLNHNPTTGRVEIVKAMPPGTPDELVKDFSSEAAAWAWAESEHRAGRMP
jgi:hypothetical protein